MQPTQPSHQSPAHPEVAPLQPAPAKAGATPAVGPLGGIVFCALCLATYVGAVVAAALG